MGKSLLGKQRIQDPATMTKKERLALQKKSEEPKKAGRPKKS